MLMFSLKGWIILAIWLAQSAVYRGISTAVVAAHSAFSSFKFSLTATPFTFMGTDAGDLICFRSIVAYQRLWEA